MIRGECVIVYAKSTFQGVCHTNEGYATEQPKGSLDHGKHKDERCTLNIVHDSHAYCQQKGGCYVKFCPDTLHNYSCPQPEVNDPSSSSIDPMSSVLITAWTPRKLARFKTTK